MRVFGLGPLEFLFCCVPFWIIIGILLLVRFTGNRGTDFGPNLPPDTPPRGGVPAGWYTDPLGRHQNRYWDGWKWTEHVADNGVGAVDPL